MKSQSGFTLIEMVAVIIILAIMAATALPRFANLSKDARLSSVNGLAGGLRSAVALTKAKWLVAASTNVSAVDLNGTIVKVIYDQTANPMSSLTNRGTPLTVTTDTTTGIFLALDSQAGYSSGLTATGSFAFYPPGVAASNGCWVELSERATLQWGRFC